MVAPFARAIFPPFSHQSRISLGRVIIFYLQDDLSSCGFLVGPLEYGVWVDLSYPSGWLVTNPISETLYVPSPLLSS